MIDYEDIVFSSVADELRKQFSDIYIIGTEWSDAPPRFPAVSVVQIGNEVNEKYSTFDSVENVASEEYKFEVCSNLESARSAKQQTKDIVSVIDGVMNGLSYPRVFCQPIPSADDKISRRVARYKKTNVI